VPSGERVEPLDDLDAQVGDVSCQIGDRDLQSGDVIPVAGPGFRSSSHPRLSSSRCWRFED
jgi:hypothetical protein